MKNCISFGEGQIRCFGILVRLGERVEGFTVIFPIAARRDWSERLN